METLNFNKLLIKTAFCCMASDGNIDKREVKLIKKLHLENKTFGEVNLDSELDSFLLEINQDGHQFLKDYFGQLKSSNLTEIEELKLIEVAIETIKADEKVEYSEIKFFKVIRAKLKIKNEHILEKHLDFEDYLEQDIISESYLARLKDDFFDTQVLPKFQLICEIDDDLLDSLKSENEE